MNKVFEKTENRNVGFSLVELIIVIMIMAIIAVALAPQVMKWVANARIATDTSNYDAMAANLQVALTDGCAFASADSADETSPVSVQISEDGTTITGDSSNAIASAMDVCAPGWDEIFKLSEKKSTEDKEYYELLIYGGSVYKTGKPNTANNADFS